jgi:hypothetical protein
VNLEDAIKVAGLESKMSVIDLTELVDQQIARSVPASEPRIQQEISQECVIGR